MKLSLPAPPPAPADGGAAAPALRYRIGTFWINLDETSLPWHASMRSGDGVVRMDNAVLNTFADLLEFTPVAAGDDVLELKQGAADGPVIAKLDITVVGIVEVQLWGHILTVQQTGTGAVLADPPMWTQATAQSLIDRINDIWDPAGVRFVFAGFEDHVLQEAEAGMVADDYLANNVRSADIATRLNRRNVINVYFTQRLFMHYNDSAGNPIDTHPLAHAGNRWHFHPSAVFTGHESSLEALGRVLAHEFGHMLRITRAEYAHSDDHGVITPWRHDQWSRMRLMSKTVNYQLNRADAVELDRSWQDLTYGDYDEWTQNAGDLITVKNLGHDNTDDDVATARRSVTANPTSHTGLPLPAHA